MHGRLHSSFIYIGCEWLAAPILWTGGRITNRSVDQYYNRAPRPGNRTLAERTPYRALLSVRGDSIRKGLMHHGAVQLFRVQVNGEADKAGIHPIYEETISGFAN